MPNLNSLVLKTLEPIGKVFAPLQRTGIRMWYGFVSRRGFDTDLNFLNLGWAPVDGEAELDLVLTPEEESQRYGIQLYHQLARHIDWSGLHAVEVGCGRGGGAAFVARHLSPASLTGIDLTPDAIAYCRRTHHQKGLTFQVGDAQDLPMEDASVDVVLNVESSHGYPDYRAFLDEAARVLKPGGWFLHADFRSASMGSTWATRLSGHGFEVVEDSDITANAIRALELDHERRLHLFEQHIPRLVLPHFKSVIGLGKSSIFYAPLTSGEMIYRSFVCRKAAR